MVCFGTERCEHWSRVRVVSDLLSSPVWLQRVSGNRAGCVFVEGTDIIDAATRTDRRLFQVQRRPDQIGNRRNIAEGLGMFQSPSLFHGLNFVQVDDANACL